LACVSSAPIYVLLKAAGTRAVAAGTLLADPFGHGFCLLELVDRGYDEIAST
jgi:hypothetical protein